MEAQEILMTIMEIEMIFGDYIRLQKPDESKVKARTCAVCGEWFKRTEKWQKICFACWRKQKIASGEWRGK
ncbi:MAG: hypothetical protein HQL73_13075 [Magnetococcales bacterium]|nr:hypothetical protein [Magnetococcales bacterium]